MTAEPSRLTTADAIDVYKAYMTDIKQRLAKARRMAVDQHSPMRNGEWDQEVIFLLLRKCLEELAFSSLVANKEAYASAHSDFERHWKFKPLLEKIEKLNPSFYPTTLEATVPTPQRIWRFTPMSSGFMTREDMEFLYSVCSEVLHPWNPYRPGKRQIDTRRPMTEWIKRFELLLSTHYVRLLSGGMWLIQMSGGPGGTVNAARADPVDDTA